MPCSEIAPALDPDFRPASLATREYRALVDAAGGGTPFVLGLGRPDGSLSRLELRVLPEDHPDARRSLQHVERILKLLLWQRGGNTVYAGGSQVIAEHLAHTYVSGGTRAFDAGFMADVYCQPFAVVPCSPSAVPPTNELRRSLGGHLDGCRVGFDLGASDRKVVALRDGEVVFSEEVVWEPSTHDDPEYHYREIAAGLRSAAARLPRVDAIGGSSAGIVVDNQFRVASLFRAVPRKRYDQVRQLIPRLRRELGVPMEVVNDGEVAALAGAMALEDTGVLGIALGSSLAAGYIGLDGKITGWLNELAFAPVDYSPRAPIDDWSGDRGCGAQYFSQQCVFRHAPKVGIVLAEAPPAIKLAAVQRELEAGHQGAAAIWQTMGVYLGHGIAHYADFFELKHVLLLGRCTSGQGGQILADQATLVLQTSFPDLASRIAIHLPDERSRRVGQGIAAASLPRLADERPRQ
jgi:predicted NBD/HSP70 family sugar kinase